jgi:FdhD protein
LGVKLAKDLGITLIGFVRGQKMNVYANEWRLIDA